jgi:hypothetical protein
VGVEFNRQAPQFALCGDESVRNISKRVEARIAVIGAAQGDADALCGLIPACLP